MLFHLGQTSGHLNFAEQAITHEDEKTDFQAFVHAAPSPLLQQPLEQVSIFVGIRTFSVY
jgi:hypothetical protein